MFVIELGYNFYLRGEKKWLKTEQELMLAGRM